MEEAIFINGFEPGDGTRYTVFYIRRPNGVYVAIGAGDTIKGGSEIPGHIINQFTNLCCEGHEDVFITPDNTWHGYSYWWNKASPKHVLNGWTVVVAFAIAAAAWVNVEPVKPLIKAIYHREYEHVILYGMRLRRQRELYESMLTWAKQSPSF